jgi:hypothetical protein
MEEDQNIHPRTLRIPYAERNAEGSEHPASFGELEWDSALGDPDQTPASLREEDKLEAMESGTSRFPGLTNIPQDREWPKTTGPEAEKWVDRKLQSEEDSLQKEAQHHSGFFGKHPDTIAPQQQFLHAMSKLAGLVKAYDRNTDRKTGEIKKMMKLERRAKGQFEADEASLRSDAPESERWHIADENGKW